MDFLKDPSLGLLLMSIYINDSRVPFENNAIPVLVTDNTNVIISNTDNNCQQYLNN